MTHAQDRVDAAGRDLEENARISDSPTAAILALVDVVRQYAVEMLEPNEITLTVEESERTVYHGEEKDDSWADLLLAYLDGETDVLDFKGHRIPERLQVLLAALEDSSVTPGVTSDIEHYCAGTLRIEPGNRLDCSMPSCGK